MRQECRFQPGGRTQSRPEGEAARILLVTAEAGTGKTTVPEQDRRTAAQAGAAVVRLDWEDEDAEDTADATVLDAGRGLTVEDPDGCLPSTVARRRAGGRGERAVRLLRGADAEAPRQTPFALVVDSADALAPRCGSSAREAYLW
ncbi:hypothetical protein [Streptomyces sp. 4F14]|uniref:hypothetical protein n=1 Tax=Streptomyces sp. 4F14 TaxID=3394380 RepID=UPI003A8855BE